MPWHLLIFPCYQSPQAMSLERAARIAVWEPWSMRKTFRCVAPFAVSCQILRCSFGIALRLPGSVSGCVGQAGFPPCLQPRQPA